MVAERRQREVFMKGVVSKIAFTLGFLLMFRPVFAEDIDLFLGLPASEIDTPNVLFIVDNTANWNTPFTAEMAALASVFNALPEGAVNVGIMMFTESGGGRGVGGNSGEDGGYVRAAIRPMTSANKTRYASLIESFDRTGDASNNGKAGLTMAEAYFYFAGLNAESGREKAKTDYKNNTFGAAASRDVYAIPDEGTFKNALNSKDALTYNSPITPGFCGKNYIIWVGNGAAQDNNSDSRRAEDLLRALGGNAATTTIPITPSGSQGNMADEWARFMYQSPEAITTFTLDINKVTTGQGPGWSALLRSMAEQSAGVYYDIPGDYDSIAGALNDALSRILSVNSVFASVALPASANTQSTFLNQVYIGLFRPDANADPRWYGNLKQYKLGFDGNNVLRVVDRDEDPVVDAGTGFITECAESFWTPTAVDDYWAFLPATEQRGVCQAVANSKTSNYPDGPVVEKGAQAYVTRSQSPSTRTVYTCGPGVAACSGDPATFATGNSNITSAILGTGALATARESMIRWAIGFDEDDENGNDSTVDMRPSVHGDIIHSQPVALDYASNPANPQVVVFYGGNDGMLRAINGNRSSTHSGAVAGREIWSFMPPEFWPQIKRNRENTTKVRFPASGANAGEIGEQKPYGVDGAITAFDNGVNRYIYFGLRRGGRSIYAFDVSNVTDPKILWRRGCPNKANDTGCSAGWENIGETWSPNAVTQIFGSTTPVIITGGGYDACEDFDNDVDRNHVCSASSKGNSIFVVDGVSGELLKEFITQRPVVGAVTLVPVSDVDRNIAYAYATDTGGNVYRISGATANTPIGETIPANWTMTKIASLGCDTIAGSCNANRKFLFGPDVVRDQLVADRLVILVGSGDREKPLLTYGAAASVSNYFFALFDFPTQVDWLNDPLVGAAGHCGANLLCMNSLTEVDRPGATELNDPVVAVGDKGWKMSLAATEQVVSGALTVSSVVNFSTQIPSTPDPEACSANLGEAATYNIGFDTGAGIKNNIIGGGLVPTPVAGKVILDDGQIVPFCIGCGGEGSAIGGSQVISSTSWLQHKSRVYWKIEK
jgi:type IV pilus assembly protein PilY1